MGKRVTKFLPRLTSVDHAMSTVLVWASPTWTLYSFVTTARYFTTFRPEAVILYPFGPDGGTENEYEPLAAVSTVRDTGVPSYP